MWYDVYMNTTRVYVYAARIPYVTDDTTLDAITAVIASLPSVLEIVRDDDPPRSSADSYAFVVTTTDPSALVRDVRTACDDEPTDESRVEFLD